MMQRTDNLARKRPDAAPSPDEASLEAPLHPMHQALLERFTDATEAETERFPLPVRVAAALGGGLASWGVVIAVLWMLRGL